MEERGRRARVAPDEGSSAAAAAAAEEGHSPGAESITPAPDAAAADDLPALDTEPLELTWYGRFQHAANEREYRDVELSAHFCRRGMGMSGLLVLLGVIIITADALRNSQQNVGWLIVTVRSSMIIAIHIIALAGFGLARAGELSHARAQQCAAVWLCAFLSLMVFFTRGRAVWLVTGIEDSTTLGIDPRSFQAEAMMTSAVLITSGLYVPMDVVWFHVVLIWGAGSLLAGAFVPPSPSAASSQVDVQDVIALVVVFGVISWAVRTRAATERGQWWFRRTVARSAAQRRAAADAELELRVRATAAELATQARARLIRIVMHDLRSPLLAVHQLASGLAEREGSTALEEAGVQRAINALVTCASLMEGIVSDMLDFERIDSGRLILVRQPFTPAKLIDDARDALGALAGRKGVALEFEEVPPALAATTFIGDARRILQCLANGVSNAVKFVEPAGGRVVVRVWESAHPSPPPGDPTWSTLHVSVEDNGIGLNADELAALGEGELFKQVGRGQMQGSGGTGLGLAIVRSILKQHDESELHLHSDGHRKGTTFEMRLFVKRAELSRSQSISGSPSTATSATRSAPPSAPSSGQLPSRRLPGARGMPTRLSRGVYSAGSAVAPPGGPLWDAAERVEELPEDRESASERTASVSNSGAWSRDHSPAFGMRGAAGPLAGAAASAAQQQPLPELPAWRGDGAAPPELPNVSTGPQPRALHVEDDMMLQLTIGEQLFRRAEVDWATANNGVEALEAVKAAEEEGRPFTFIVMDNQMPRMGGTQCAGTLRSRGFRGTIVGVTGDPAGSPDRAEFEEAGLDVCHDKTSEGMAAIERLLRDHIVAYAFDGGLHWS